MKISQLATLLLACLLNALPVAASAQPFTISADGNEVTDQKTGLIWRRCAEGMNWDGSTCAGVATTFTHEAALQRAAVQATSTGTAWRLPNIKELSSIIDGNRSIPAIDLAAFPATPSNLFWSASIVDGSRSIPAIDTTAFQNTPANLFWSTASGKGTPSVAWNINFNIGTASAVAPDRGTPGVAWNVNFNHGHVINNNRYSGYYVRLVRDATR
ncbi:MAG: DUF1566 domain-containing protein [Candidatus Nitrotoga sp.]